MDKMKLIKENQKLKKENEELKNIIEEQKAKEENIRLQKENYELKNIIKDEMIKEYKHKGLLSYEEQDKSINNEEARIISLLNRSTKRIKVLIIRT